LRGNRNSLFAAVFGGASTAATVADRPLLTVEASSSLLFIE
jgi:hypothetical protein